VERVSSAQFLSAREATKPWLCTQKGVEAPTRSGSRHRRKAVSARADAQGLQP
jgi:hypothetical protein